MKYGFGHVTDQVCEAIHQKLYRDEAIKIVKNFMAKVYDKYVKKIL